MQRRRRLATELQPRVRPLQPEPRLFATVAAAVAAPAAVSATVDVATKGSAVRAAQEHERCLGRDKVAAREQHRRRADVVRVEIVGLGAYLNDLLQRRLGQTKAASAASAARAHPGPILAVARAACADLLRPEFAADRAAVAHAARADGTDRIALAAAAHPADAGPTLIRRRADAPAAAAAAAAAANHRFAPAQ